MTASECSRVDFFGVLVPWVFFKAGSLVCEWCLGREFKYESTCFCSLGGNKTEHPSLREGLGEWGAGAGTGTVVRGCRVPVAGLDWFVQQKLSHLLEARTQTSLSLEHFLALYSLWFFFYK